MKRWGLPLAQALSEGLAGTRIVKLAAIEPDLDPAVHHTNEPYAIISDTHAIALVEGTKLVLDGPQRTNNNSRYVNDDAQLAANRAELAAVTAAWGRSPADHAGLIDTALSIMRFLKQRGRWGVYVSGHHEGLEGYIAARSPTDQRWPAALSLLTTPAGIRLSCGEHTRTINALSELADFAQREGAALDAQVLWCTQFEAILAKLRPVGQAVLEAIQRGVTERAWSLWLPEGYFHLATEPHASISTPDTRAVTATLELAGDRFQLTIGAYVRRFSSSADVVARCEEIVSAVKTWLASPDAEPPVRDMDYYR